MCEYIDVIIVLHVKLQINVEISEWLPCCFLQWESMSQL